MKLSRICFFLIFIACHNINSSSEIKSNSLKNEISKDSIVKAKAPKVDTVKSKGSIINDSLRLNTTNVQVVEEFKTFLNHFDSDKKFQIERTKFPFKSRSVDCETGNKSLRYINSPEYKIENFTYDESYATRQKNAFRQHIEIDKTNAKIIINGIENGISVVHKFALINNKWYYVEVIDQSC